jgi:hypothetical protein
VLWTEIGLARAEIGNSTAATKAAILNIRLPLFANVARTSDSRKCR